MSSKASMATSSAAVGDVGGQQRLVAGAVEVDRIVGDAAVADREREAVDGGVQLARDPLGDAAQAASSAVGQQHDDVVLRVAAAVEHGGERAGSAGAGGALGARRARGRASRRRRARSGARGRRPRRRPSARSAPSSEARATMSPRSVTLRAKSALRKAACAASEARSGARRRSTSLAIIVVAIRRIAADGSPPRGAHAQAADDRVADAQLVGLHALGVAHQQPLVGGRARGDREHGARAVDQHQRRVERAGGGADDLGQPEPGLDRVGDLPERAEIGQRRLLAGGRGHTPKCRGVV